MSPTFRSYSLYGAQLLALFSLYFASSQWVLTLAFPLDIHRLVWPSAGVAVTALFLFGIRLWPAVFAGSLVANYLLGLPLLAALAIGVGSALKAIVGALLLQSFRFSSLFNRLIDALSFIAVALSCTVVSATIGATTLAAAGIISIGEIPASWTGWWIGDALGILILGSFAVRWLANPQGFRRTTAQYAEVFVFLVVISMTALLIFWEPIPRLNGFVPIYMLFVPLTWGALRIGPRFTTFGMATIAAIAITATVAGVGPFGPDALADEFFGIQLYLATLSIIFLLFVSAVEERKEIMKGLQADVVSLTEDVQIISEADRAKNDFIATLSHELRNPLAPILSTLEILRMRGADSHALTMIETTRENVMRMTRLLDDLLDVARISRKQIVLKTAEIRLRRALIHACEMARPLMEKYRHSFSVELPDDDIVVRADQLRIEQVIVNLLNNAAKYTPPGGNVSLQARLAGDTAEIRVRDNGIGISRRDQERIFEPFRQVHERERVSESSGLGIGLSLAKRFVELHGGTIEVVSAGSGKGSEFIVRLPDARIEQPVPPPQASAPAAIPAPASAATAPRKRSDGRKVLIVDDNQDAANAIAQLLNHSGHDAHVAFSGAEALQALANFAPDIIFLDIGLANESGYDVARTIRTYIDPAPILVALTGYSSPDDQAQAREAGFAHHLVKPVSIADLENILATA